MSLSDLYLRRTNKRFIDSTLRRIIEESSSVAQKIRNLLYSLKKYNSPKEEKRLKQYLAESQKTLEELKKSYKRHKLIK